MEEINNLNEYLNKSNEIKYFFDHINDELDKMLLIKAINEIIEWFETEIGKKLHKLYKDKFFENVNIKDRMKLIEQDINTICGCTKANMLSTAHFQCPNCSHSNALHNFGKGCRVTFDPIRKEYGRIEKDGDYSSYHKLLD